MRTLALVFALSLAAACTYSSTTWTPRQREGPPFSESFPDPSVLLTTKRVEATRTILSSTPLPETTAHHDELVLLAQSSGSIDTDHLLLLTEAVAVPTAQESANFNSNGLVTVITIDDNGERRFFARGAGEFSSYVDAILLAGADKLSDPSPTNFGRLVGATQSAETVGELAEKLLDRCDDGSPAALDEIAEAIPLDEIRKELYLGTMIPRNLLNGERARIAAASLSFDSNRSELIDAWYATLDEVPLQMVEDHVALMSFDEGRANVLEAAAERVPNVDRQTMVDILSEFSFDSGRLEAVQHLAPRLTLASFDDAVAIMRTTSFDSGRDSALDILLEHRALSSVDADGLITAARLSSFDSSRTATLTKLRPFFAGNFDRKSAIELVEANSFGSGKLKVIELYAKELRKLSMDDRRAVIDKLSFDSERESAREFLIY